MNESCHTYQWVMSHTWMSHVAHMNESCHTNGSVTSHGNTLQYTATHCNTLQHTATHYNEWVNSHMDHTKRAWAMSHTDESCHILVQKWYEESAYARICIYMYVYRDVYTFKFTHTYTCMHVQVFSLAGIVYWRIDIYMFKYVHWQICKYMYTFTYTHTYIYPCMQIFNTAGVAYSSQKIEADLVLKTTIGAFYIRTNI